MAPLVANLFVVSRLLLFYSSSDSVSVVSALHSVKFNASLTKEFLYGRSYLTFAVFFRSIFRLDDVGVFSVDLDNFI